MTIMPFDELNAFKEQLPIHFDADGHIRSKQDEEDIIDGHVTDHALIT